jgi:hypothetical protein
MRFLREGSPNQSVKTEFLLTKTTLSDHPSRNKAEQTPLQVL